MKEPKPGIYHHYKGKLYQVLAVATLSGTEDDPTPTRFVFYRKLYDDFGLNVRPLSEWCQPHKDMARFALVIETGPIF